MNAMRFVLPVLVAATMIVGDCTESQARCRLFGRRHARRSCPSSVPGYSPRVPHHQTPSYSGSTPCDTWVQGMTIVCPLYETSYNMGGGYRMFYGGTYNGSTPEACGNNPQPIYLLTGSTVGCCVPNNECDVIVTHYNARKRPHNLAKYGNPKLMPPLWAGQPVARHKINFSDFGYGERAISFHEKALPATATFPATTFSLGFEHRAQGFPLVAPVTLERWHDHDRGFKITLPGDARVYWVILSDQ